ncbi:MAG TPA: hypothetical protein VMH05_01620 [Bryobacteraceae bacterium]|nr:hypothetical protein [Bryobacteraceae bacterium]
MAATDPEFYTRALRRVGVMILALGTIGAGALTSLKGFRMGLAFLIGALLSYASFWGWQHAVLALSPGAQQKKSWCFMFRIILLAGAAIAIIKLLGLSVAAAVTGLLVSAAAVILEIIYELIYARA